MTLGRIIRNGKGFEYVELDLGETGKAIDDTAELNLLIWRRCFAMAEEFCSKTNNGETAIGALELAKLLFTAASVKLYTELDSELSRKVHLAKNDQGNKNS